MCNTFHVYENELHEVDLVLSEGVSTVNLPSWSGGFEKAGELIHYENTVRTAVLRRETETIQRIYYQYEQDDGLCQVLRAILYLIAMKKLDDQLKLTENKAAQLLQEFGVDGALL